MKYTDKGEALREIKRRGAGIRREHERRTIRLLSGAVCLMTFVLVGALGLMGGMVVGQDQNIYGSFLLPVEAGSYVLTALIAFVSGMVITALIKHYTGKSTSTKKDDVS
ncbi:MAG: hypothetical protein K6E84_10425 [Lachnospiraceae bacterium]|nr:hypothetical protein [Lachnospiraceae bacterium]